MNTQLKQSMAIILFVLSLGGVSQARETPLSTERLAEQDAKGLI